MSVWNRCLSHLSNELSVQEMTTWVLCLQANETEDCIKLLAPNEYVRDKVASSYAPRIKEIAIRLAERDEFNVLLDVGIGEIPASAKPVGGEKTAFPDSSTVNGGATAHASSVHAGAGTSIGPAKDFQTALNPSFNFDTYIEGKSNQFGRAAALQIGENPGGSYNPLFIYGGVGLGKTHLMQAVGNLMVSRGARKVQYLHSERFVREMVQSLRNGTQDKFKKHYRSLDALLVDDIQFFANKTQTQEEFFHTFNALLENGQQIIMTCDRYPQEIDGVEERLKSRFGWGLTVAIEPPELETRVAILKAKADQYGYTLPDDVSFFIANRIASNVRELEGALRRVAANSQFTGKPITIDFVKDALKDLLAVRDRLVTIPNIQKAVCDYYQVRNSDLLSKKRNRSIARPRQVAMFLSKKMTRHSLPEIGEAFGGRDHTTVLHAFRKVTELSQSDNRMEEDIKHLTRALSQ